MNVKLQNGILKRVQNDIIVMPDLIWHPEAIENDGFRLSPE